ncbi:hypothetical protein AMTRI_Chr05g70330 [Amborella trichopoda]
MMQLSKLLHAIGFHITFVKNEFNHKSRSPMTASLQNIPEACYYTRLVGNGKYLNGYFFDMLASGLAALLLLGSLWLGSTVQKICRL